MTQPKRMTRTPGRKAAELRTVDPADLQAVDDMVDLLLTQGRTEAIVRWVFREKLSPEKITALLAKARQVVAARAEPPSPQLRLAQLEELRAHAYAANDVTGILRLDRRIDELQRFSAPCDGSTDSIRAMVCAAQAARASGHLSRDGLSDVLRTAAALTNLLHAERKGAEDAPETPDDGSVPETEGEATERALALIAASRRGVQ